MEDLDSGRAKPEFETRIREDLTWLELSWEGPVLRQSERFPAYRTALERLEADGLLYPCFCTRTEIAAEIARAVEAPHGPEGPHYPGTCRALSVEERKARIDSGLSYALRLDAVAATARIPHLSFHEEGSGPHGEHGTIAVDPLLFGDVVLARKDAPASYHLAVVIDDAHQGVTHVTRGNDLFAATHIQRALQALFGLPTPTYVHHKLILDAQGRKFSKRDQSVALRALRDAGKSREEVFVLLGK